MPLLLPPAYWLTALFLLLAPLSAHAQDEPAPCDPPTDKKVVKLLDEAAKAKDANARHQKLKAALEADEECAECLFQLGLSAYRIERESGRGYKAAAGYLERLDTKCPEYHADVPYLLGTMRYASDDFAGAAKAFETFRKFPTEDRSKLGRDHDKKLNEVEALMPELEFHAEFHRNTGPFEPRPLANVNTPAGEYLPMLSPDNELLFFTRARQERLKGDLIARDVEELIEARRRDVKSDFNAGRVLPEPFNTGDGYGGVTISVNNKEMFVTVCKPPDRRGYRECDIHRTHYDTHFNLDVGGQSWEWTGLDKLGEAINGEGTWESQPTLTADGTIMYFATSRPDSRGIDIYMSTRTEKDNWSPAVPVPGINTDGDEKAPFLHSDSRTLYFAARPPTDARGQPDLSRGHRGAGGYDIFFSRMNDNGTWSRPRNIGHPINTDQDEHGLIVSADGRTAYFASNRFKGAGGLDIFGFELPREARPEDVLVVKGEVRDDDGKPAANARVEIKYMDTRETETVEVDAADGRYAAVVHLRKGGDVVMTVKKQDHVFDTRTFGTEDTVRGGSTTADMTVRRIEVGKSYRVNNIHYASNSAEITKASGPVLDELIAFLRENPTVRIRIDGHTDNVGRMADNMALSNDRAFTVMEYLQRNGIKGGRLSFQGHGPTKPVATNDTPEGRALNRRTEFVITGR